MNKSESITELAKALMAAQAEMPIVAFDGTNPFHKNRYASLGAVIEKTKPILAKHNLCISQFPVSQGERLGLESILMHSSGEWMSDCILLNSFPDKGRSEAQQAGSILTYLRRYAWSALLGVYADEDTDGNHQDPSTPRFEDAKTYPPARGTQTPVNAPTPPKGHSEPVREEKQRGEAPANGREPSWVSFPVPYGKNKGVKLGVLEPNSLRWYVDNVVVSETYEDRDGNIKNKSPKAIASDQAFRDALDEAAETLSDND